ncbi:hypothetical protein BKI52_40865 [marine bacterium AO1-C]|nr:hypothetical protein BKI52_40865 [marine bacterium AO1-C]
MKNLLFFLVILLAQYDCFGQKTTSKVPLIKTMAHFFYSRAIKYEFKYNQKGQVISSTEGHYTVSKQGKWNQLDRIGKTYYKYFEDSIQVFKGKRPDYVMLLNKQKLAYEYRSYKQHADHGVIQRNTFNEQNYLINRIDYNPYDSTEIRYQYSYQFKNGNRTAETMTSYNNGKPDPGTTICTFYPNTRNTTGNQNFGELFLGKSSKNLLRGYGKGAAYYRYRFDRKGRVIERIKIAEPNSRTEYAYYD